jgi:hypothetical protein
MPQLPLILALVAALFIVVGRVGHHWPVAIAGYGLLVVAGLFVILLR